VLIRQVQITHHAKGRFVRDADVADFAGALEFGQRFQRIQQGDDRGGVGPGVAQLAKAVGRALRPVYLVEVEIIGLQALQAGVQRLADIFTIQAWFGRMLLSLLRAGPLTLEAITSFSRLPRFASQLPT
jgi:hypothetical protein